MIKPKEFLEQLNDYIAPVTRAWSGLEIMGIEVDPEVTGANENELIVDVRLLLSKD